MVIKAIKYFNKELNFITPFKTSKNIYNKRKILIIEIIDELNNSGIGECAPLPEFGTETYEEALDKIIMLCNSSADLFIDENKFDGLNNFLSQLNYTPSLRFAFDQALQGLILQRVDKLSTSIFTLKSKHNININAVVGFGEQKEIIDRISAFIKQGFKTIKLKCGRDNFKDDLKILLEIRDNFRDDINLRLDINGNWNFSDAKNYINELEEFNLEYIEQPVLNAPELVELNILSKVNIAADESVKNFDDAKYLLNNGIKFLVIKPTVAGGILNTLSILNEAEKYRANVIVSSSFESPIGKSMLVYLASLTNHEYAHGLSTNDLFVSNICDDPYTVTNGIINFDISSLPLSFRLYD